MSGFTKGPLQVGYEFDETGYPLFVVAGLSGDKKRDRESLEATARLFAAAPELFEALKGLYEDQLDYIRINNLSGAENNHWMVAARAALAKVTGEEK